MSATRIALLVASLCLVVGCASSVVGSECRSPYVVCGRYCVDLATDGLHCGVCGNACALGCVGGACVLPDAAANADAARHDGGHDAGPPDGAADASTDAGSDAFIRDVGTDAQGDAGGPRCGIGQMLCGASCVDPRDATHCGDCTTACAGTDVCASGRCAADCGALLACGTRCVDASRDAHHCGDCATDCGAGTCVAGACASASSGHLVYIGHDFETRRIAMSILVANAVRLAPRASVRVLAYEGDASALGISGANAAIAEAAGGATYAITVAPNAGSVPVLLDETDVLLVYAQTNATDAGLRTIGYTWRDALDAFLHRGGVVVVLEAPSLVNSGTYQILDEARLFAATAINEMLSPRLVAVVGRESDPVLAGVGFPYAGERHTVRVSTLDPDAIVTTGSGLVVFHRVVAD